MRKREVLRRLRAALRDPERLGDVAVYKSELLGARGNPALEAELLALSVPLPEVDEEAWARLPRGTLGRETLEFLRERNLRPFRLSPEVPPELVSRNIFTARYSLLHDVIHVLTGFGTTWTGEIGVWAVVAAQGYARSHKVAVLIATVLYPFLAPRQLRRLWHNRRLGARIGARARNLMTAPFEQLWDQPLAEVRAALRVDPADELTATAEARSV